MKKKKERKKKRKRRKAANPQWWPHRVCQLCSDPALLSVHKQFNFQFFTCLPTEHHWKLQWKVFLFPYNKKKSSFLRKPGRNMSFEMLAPEAWALNVPAISKEDYHIQVALSLTSWKGWAGGALGVACRWGPRPPPTSSHFVYVGFRAS